MLYSSFKDDQISRLGFGAMRFPLLPDGNIDTAQVNAMIKLCMDAGVNYFDTAHPYHGGLSEIILAQALSAYPRESYRLATKYPGHQIAQSYNPAEIFEEQLLKCGVEYFDYYLLHNVYEKSLPVYLDPKWGIVDYFVAQKEAGRIKHLGFSTHGSLACIKEFLHAHGDAMEFCQIELNYLDWTLQNAREKLQLLQNRGLGVWVMEPVRGGMLCKLPKAAQDALQAANPARTQAQWAMLWQLKHPTTVVLSGASSLEQLRENIATFSAGETLSADEETLLFQIANSLKNSVPCTACRYCCMSCPAGLDIPYLMEIANDVRVAPTVTASMSVDALPAGKGPKDCTSCGACETACPQNIAIPEVIQEMVRALESVGHWEDMCVEREREAREVRATLAKS